MSEWVAVVLAGAIGGTANALLTGDILWPFRYRDADDRLKLNPGIIGNVVIGAITGFVFWGMYTAGADFGSHRVTPQTVSGCLLAGAGGGRILTGFVEKSLQGAALANAGTALEATATIGQQEGV